MHQLSKYVWGEHQEERNFRLSFCCLFLLALIHFAIDLRLGKQSHFMMSAVVWTAVGLLLWDKLRACLHRPDNISSFVGYGMIAALLTTSMVHPSSKLMGFFPLLGCLGWFLIFEGAASYRLFWRELAALVAFGIPKLLPDSIFGLQVATAKLSAYLLWRLDYPIALQATTLHVPNGSVEVVPTCSGLTLMAHMFSVAVIFLCVFPVGRVQAILLPLIAIALGFLTNGVRIALLAVLSPPASAAAFQYWHSSSGASMFVLASLILYMLVYGCLSRTTPQRRSKNPV
ncbi:MAG TPA: cyanoexosortase A [Stenomitos sp.]